MPAQRTDRDVTTARLRRAAGRLRGALQPAAAESSHQVDEVRRAIGALQARQLRTNPPPSLRDAEFRVFSQWGEDGAIQYLIHSVPVADEVFVEIGVEDWSESNTRFLAMNDNWRGLIVDGADRHQAFLRESGLGWRHTVDAVTAFVTAENVDDVLAGGGITGDIGLLSIDIDGMDYWVWQAVSTVRPALVVIEFNALFGPDAAVTVPYDPAFRCRAAHHSGQYFGASLAAMEQLGAAKGYRLVGASSQAVNAFFVRADLDCALPTVSAAQAWRAPRFRTARDEAGHLTLESDRSALLAAMAGLPLVDVATGASCTVADVLPR